MIKRKFNKLLYMEFNHNFCESRINNNESPEILNSFSSLVITLIPFMYRTPSSKLLINIKHLLIFNGFSSFIYHYYLSWMGKHLDEISMILMNYYGINYLLDVFLFTNHLFDFFSMLNLYFAICFLTINTFPDNDYLFPIIFTIYLVPTIYLIIAITNVYQLNHKYIYNSLTITLIGALSWIISEIYCNEITKYGHIIWHCLFPLGFYKIIDNFDRKFIEV